MSATFVYALCADDTEHPERRIVEVDLGEKFKGCLSPLEKKKKSGPAFFAR